MRSFHDYHLVAYRVDGERRELTLELAWLYPDDPSPRPRETVTFRQVEGYFLEHDLGVNIVYSIEEVNIEEHIFSHALSFEEQSRWGWPLYWKGTVENTLEHLKGVGAKCFLLSTSYGLTGWVVCREVPQVHTKEDQSD